VSFRRLRNPGAPGLCDRVEYVRRVKARIYALQESPVWREINSAVAYLIDEVRLGLERSERGKQLEPIVRRL
jgi:hypothetical protein